MKNVEKTIVSQYANSPILVQLIHNMNEYIDPTANIDGFFSTIWKLHEATGFGLDIWGRILGVSRLLTIPGPFIFLGFSENLADAQPFGQAPFHVESLPNQNYLLEDEVFRRILFVKALSNISTCSTAQINQLLINLYGSRGKAFAIDLGSMHMLLLFEFLLQPFELALIEQSTIIPRPTGVRLSILQIDYNLVFGFREMGAGVQPLGFGSLQNY